MRDRELLCHSYPAVPASVPTARADVVCFARASGAPESVVENVRLVISEAVTNCVLHAYGDELGEVHVTAAMAEGDLWVLVSDDGQGLRTRSNSPGLGLGLVLIEQLTRDLAIERGADGGTRLRMRFPVQALREVPISPLRQSLLSRGPGARSGRHLQPAR